MSDLSERQQAVLIYAFRYALGRRSYATHEMADEIRRQANNLSAFNRDLIVREIRTAIEEDRAGDDADIRIWAGLALNLTPKEHSK